MDIKLFETQFRQIGMSNPHKYIIYNFVMGDFILRLLKNMKNMIL